MPRPTILFAFLAPFAATGGCATAEAELLDHTHTVTTTVTVTDNAILPKPRVAIPVYSAVVWRNHGTAPLEVSISATTCGGCETVLGFAPSEKGACSIQIPSGSVASLCFHYAGEFPFVAKVGDREQRGEIVVGGER
jgi:hypothetical protein